MVGHMKPGHFVHTSPGQIHPSLLCVKESCKFVRSKYALCC